MRRFLLVLGLSISVTLSQAESEPSRMEDHEAKEEVQEKPAEQWRIREAGKETFVPAAKKDRPVILTGSVEGGYMLGGAPRDSQWLIDQLELNHQFDATDHVQFFFNNSIAVDSPTLSPTAFNNSVNYFSTYRISSEGFTLANSGAYFEVRLAEGAVFHLGHFRTPFGMESLTPRYDATTYFYSSAFSIAQSNHWNWNTGVQAELSEFIPGRLTLAIIDGRVGAGYAAPALSGRYQINIDTPSFSISPIVTAYLGRFSPLPWDIGFTAGFQFVRRSLSVNAEFLMVKRPTLGLVTDPSTNTSWYVEPAYEFKLGEFSLKAEGVSNLGQSDFNIGLGFTKTLMDRFRLRVLVQLAGLEGRVRANQTDIRVFLGTYW